MTPLPRRFLLVADDYGLSPGVCGGIDALARAGRLSGTGAIVTLPDWPQAGLQAAQLRPRVAVGLHLNLTLGAPLGQMPRHAPAGVFPPVPDWIRRALAGRIDRSEVGAEITRQLRRFEEVTGAAPDLIDGHHHVHALPGVRDAVAAALRAHFGSRPLPLLRLPLDSAQRILRRGAAPSKALLVAALSSGARRLFTALGAPVNIGFSGFSPFRRDIAFADELERFRRLPGPFHMIMCHPGAGDPAPFTRDPVFLRREDEMAALMACPDLPALIHHPAQARGANGRIDWEALRAA